MSKPSDFYHPEEIKWGDYQLELSFCGYRLDLSDHVTEEEYAKLSPKEREELVIKIATDHAKEYVRPFKVVLCTKDSRGL